MLVERCCLDCRYCKDSPRMLGYKYCDISGALDAGNKRIVLAKAHKIHYGAWDGDYSCDPIPVDRPYINCLVWESK